MQPASLRSISSHSNEPVCDHLILCIHLKLNGPILNHACTLTAVRLRISTRPPAPCMRLQRARRHIARSCLLSSRGIIKGHICQPSAVMACTLPHCHHAWPILSSACARCHCGRLSGRPAHCHRAHRSRTDVVTRCCRHALLLSRAVVVIVHAVITWLICRLI